MSKRAAIYKDLLWSGSPSQWLNLKWHIAFAATAIISLAAIAFVEGANILWLMPLLGMAVWWLWQVLVVKYTKFHLLHERIIIESGVLNKTTNQVELHRVRDYKVSEPFIQRLLGLGSVRIWSIDRNEPVFVIPGMKNPRGLHELIRQTKLQYVGQTRQVEIG